VRRWPLLLIAAPAAVSIWSGWVGLGEMCGFGIVHPLPGIADGFRLNTAITLPVGVEAYGAYALGAWLSLAPGHPARTFARRSAIGSLVLGMLGQVVYHLLAAAHAHRAPWPVVVLVSCLPVVTLGFGAALTHLLRSPGPGGDAAGLTGDAAAVAGELAAGLGAWAAELRVTPTVPEPAPAASGPGADAPDPHSGLNGPGHAALEMFAADIAGGRVPALRAIQSQMRIGQAKAQQVQGFLREMASANGGGTDGA
jgi:hypothetical protein